MTVYVVDAHPLVWVLEGNPRLGPAARAVLSSPVAYLVLPVTALAEACWVVSTGRTSLADWRDVVAAVRNDPRFELAPLDAAVVARAMSLPVSLEMHDAQLVATGLILARSHADVRILTCDRSITESRLLPTVW